MHGDNEIYDKNKIKMIKTPLTNVIYLQMVRCCMLVKHDYLDIARSNKKKFLYEIQYIS